MNPTSYRTTSIHARIPRNIERDDETMLRDRCTPSESFSFGQAWGERYAIPSGHEGASHYLYHLTEAEDDINDVISHLLESERAKRRLPTYIAPVPEYRVWHRAPLNALAYTFGRRIVPGLIVAAEITKEWMLVADTLKWFNTEWLPKAEAAAGVARMMSRVDSRTLPMDNIFLPLIDEFREKFYCIVDYLRYTYPELPIRVGG